MDQGIIANFKRFYRSLVLSHVVHIKDKGSESLTVTIANSLSVLQSLNMQKQEWNTVTASTIANCYRKAGFAKYSLMSTEYIHLEEVTDFQPIRITDLDFRNYVTIVEVQQKERRKVKPEDQNSELVQ